MKAGLYNIETNDFIASWDEIISNGLDVLHNYDDYYEEIPLDDQDLSPAAHIFDKLNKEDVPLKLVIPENIEKIGDCVFKECDNLKEVVIENGVKEIGDCVFDECNNLTSIYIPDSVIKIGECAFICCESLEHITLPKNLEEIPNECFSGCWKLKEISLPDSITKIGTTAFYNTPIENITIPKNVKVIGANAFYYCEKLKKVTLNEGLQEIEERAFNNCHELNTLKIPKSVKYIHESIFGFYSNIDNKKIIIQNELNKEFMDKFKNNIVYLSLDILLNEGKSLREISNIYKGNDDSLYR